MANRHHDQRTTDAWLRAMWRIRYSQPDHLCTCVPPRSRGTVIPDGTEKIKPIQPAVRANLYGVPPSDSPSPVHVSDELAIGEIERRSLDKH